MTMKIRESEKDVKMASTSESLGAVRERERERELYSNEIKGIGKENSGSNLATVKTGANIAICAKSADKMHVLQTQEEGSKNAKNRIKERGVTLVALVVTILFPYDEKLKCSNSKGFLLTTI